MSVSIASNLLNNLFQNVYFINGTAYAGKSTIVKMLAEKQDVFLHSAFFTLIRNDNRIPAEPLAILKEHFGL